MRPTANGLRRAIAMVAAALTAGAIVAAPATAGPAATTDTAASSCATFGAGSTGGAVRAIQKLVGVTVDGQFGAATAKALSTWQTAHHVTASGVVDAGTWSVLPPAVALHVCSRGVHGSGVTLGCAKLAAGADGIAVEVLQTALKTTADGQFGASTATSLEAAQKAAGLTVTGVTNRKTWHALHLSGTPVCTSRSATPPLPKDWKAQQKVRAKVNQLAAALEEAPGTTSSQVALAAVHFARKQIGKPYAWGGVGPKSYDCSGLQMTAYLHAGITIPRVAAAQYTGSGPTVPLDQAQQGDLLFYASDVTKPSTIYHVVMYVGSGNILDAPHTGATVGIRPLWTTDLLPVVVRPVSGLVLPTQVGATGWTVSQLQQALDRHGASLAVDGGFGPSTQSAVKAWQTRKKLTASGIVGLDTWLTLG